MPMEQAAAAFQEYRHAVRSAKMATLNSEDAQIARAYKALADGKQVLNIMEAFESAGVDALGLPRLAISRADQKTIAVWLNKRDGRVELGPARKIGFQRRGSLEGLVFQFPAARQDDRSIERYAVVPNIPP